MKRELKNSNLRGVMEITWDKCVPRAWHKELNMYSPFLFFLSTSKDISCITPTTLIKLYYG